MSAQGQHNSTVSFQSFHTLVGRQRIPHLKQYESQLIWKFLFVPANNDLMGGVHCFTLRANIYQTKLTTRHQIWDVKQVDHLICLPLACPGLTQVLATYVDWDNWFLDNALRHLNW